MTAEVDPFEEVRIRKIQQPNSLEQPHQEINQEDPFSDVRIKKAEGFPLIYETGRHAARIGSRIAETLGGIPGDVSSLIQSGVFAGLEKLTGHKASPEIFEEAKKQRPPTTHELQETSERLTGGFTSPQSEVEKLGDEFVKTATSLLGPMKFRKALGVAAGSEAVKEGLKIMGVGEGGQESGKFGTILLMSMINPGGAMKYASSQYQRSNDLSKGASIIAKDMEKNVSSLILNLEKGVSTTSKNAVMKPAREIVDKIKNGKILVEDLTAAKRDLNTIMKDPEVLQREKKLLKVLGKEVDQAIKPYEKINPEFSKAYRPANEIYGAVMQGTKASDFIKKTLGAKSILGAALGELAIGHPEFILPTAGAAIGAFATAKGIDFFVRMAKSPQLQKFYAKALTSALKEDAASLRLYEDKIQEILGKD